MARPRKPDALKHAQGNPGKRKLTEKPGAETPAVSDSDAAPATAHAVRTIAAPMRLSAGARKIWDRLAADLARMSFVRHQDAHAFARYCEYLALWIALIAKVKPGSIVKTTSSAHVENMDRLDKNFAAMLMLEKRLTELEDRFGLNPRGRQMIIAQLAGMGGHHPGADLFGRDPAASGGGKPAAGTPQPQPAEPPTAGFLN